MSSKRNRKSCKAARGRAPEASGVIRPANFLALLGLLLAGCASSPESQPLEWKSVVPGRDTVAYAADPSAPASAVPETDHHASSEVTASAEARVSEEDAGNAEKASNGARNVRTPEPSTTYDRAAASAAEPIDIPPAVDQPSPVESAAEETAGSEEPTLEEVERRARPLPAGPGVGGSPELSEPETRETALVPDPDEAEPVREEAQADVVRDPERGGTPEIRPVRRQQEEVLPGVKEPVVAPVESDPSDTREPTAWNDSVVARVNGAPILFSELKEYALDQNLPLSGLKIDGLRGEAFRRAMTARVDQTLLVQAANLEDLTADELDVARRVDAFIAQRIDEAGGRARFLNRLREAQLNLDSFRSLLIKRETQRQLAAGIVQQRVTISTSELEAFEEELKKSGEPLEEVRLAQILVSCPPSEQGTELGDELFRRALDLAARAGRQPAAFSKILTEVNNDPTGRTRGGLLGWIDPTTLQPAIQEAVEKLHPGEVSPPVTTDRGHHVLFMIESRDARDKLFARKFEEQRNKLVNELRSKAQIEIYPVEGAG